MRRNSRICGRGLLGFLRRSGGGGWFFLQRVRLVGEAGSAFRVRMNVGRIFDNIRDPYGFLDCLVILVIVPPSRPPKFSDQIRMGCVATINHTLANLREWIKDEPCLLPPSPMVASYAEAAYIRKEAVGVVLVGGILFLLYTTISSSSKSVQLYFFSCFLRLCGLISSSHHSRETKNRRDTTL